MSALTDAMARLRPGLNCSDTNGTLAGIRWDPPLPPGFTPPTQADVDGLSATIAVPLEISYSQAMKQLQALGKLAAALSAAQGAGGLTTQLWYAPTWHYADFLDPNQPFKALAAGLSIDPAAFFTAAAAITS